MGGKNSTLFFDKGILKIVLTYIFSTRDEGCYFFILIVKTIQKYFACPYNP
jgi:hypothetical protein